MQLFERNRDLSEELNSLSNACRCCYYLRFQEESLLRKDEDFCLCILMSSFYFFLKENKVFIMLIFSS